MSTFKKYLNEELDNGAIAAYAKVRKEIDSLVKDFEKALKKYDEDFKKEKFKNWGHVGPLQQVKSDFKSIVKFISQ